MKRPIFDNLDELKEYVKIHPEIAKKKQVFKVVDEFENIKYVLAGNTDQAIAIVYRHRDITVESVPIHQLMQLSN